MGAHSFQDKMRSVQGKASSGVSYSDLDTGEQRAADYLLKQNKVTFNNGVITARGKKSGFKYIEREDF